MDFYRVYSIAVYASGVEVHDSKEAKKLVDDASKKHKINKSYMDGAYDSKEHFRYLDSKNIIPVIKVRENSVLDEYKR